MIGLPPANIFLFVVAWAVSSLPFYLAVRLLGGDVAFLKAMVVWLVSGMVSAGLSVLVGGLLGGLLSYIATLAVIRYFTGLSWLRCILVGFVQVLVVVGLVFLVGGLLGLTPF